MPTIKKSNLLVHSEHPVAIIIHKWHSSSSYVLSVTNASVLSLWTLPLVLAYPVLLSEHSLITPNKSFMLSTGLQTSISSPWFILASCWAAECPPCLLFIVQEDIWLQFTRGFSWHFYSTVCLVQRPKTFSSTVSQSDNIVRNLYFQVNRRKKVFFGHVTQHHTLSKSILQCTLDAIFLRCRFQKWSTQ